MTLIGVGTTDIIRTTTVIIILIIVDIMITIHDITEIDITTKEIDITEEITGVFIHIQMAEMAIRIDTTETQIIVRINNHNDA